MDSIITDWFKTVYRLVPLWIIPVGILDGEANIVSERNLVEVKKWFYKYFRPEYIHFPKKIKPTDQFIQFSMNMQGKKWIIINVWKVKENAVANFYKRN